MRPACSVLDTALGIECGWRHRGIGVCFPSDRILQVLQQLELCTMSRWRMALSLCCIMCACMQKAKC